MLWVASVEAVDCAVTPPLPRGLPECPPAPCAKARACLRARLQPPDARFRRPGGAVPERSARIAGFRPTGCLVDTYISFGLYIGVRWEVEATDQFGDWYLNLTEVEQLAINAVVDLLEERGPALGRPYADTLTGSRHGNMKELRPPEGNIRILFAFDPRRMAILLLGGDKTNEWTTWYQRMIPIADGLYDQHLENLKREGQLQ